MSSDPTCCSTGAYNAFHPVLDGKLFTEIPTLSILKGNFADVPVIVGYELPPVPVTKPLLTV